MDRQLWQTESMAGNFRNARALVDSNGNYAYGSKAWCERQLVIVIQGAMRGRGAGPDCAVQPVQPRNYAMAVQAVMALARLKGYIVERKQSIGAKIDLSKLSQAELSQYLSASLSELDPAARRQIEAITAGDDDAIDVDIDQ